MRYLLRLPVLYGAGHAMRRGKQVVHKANGRLCQDGDEALTKGCRVAGGDRET